MAASGSFFPEFDYDDLEERAENGTTYLPYLLKSFNLANLEGAVPAST